jgi:hypothetical protein
VQPSSIGTPPEPFLRSLADGCLYRHPTWDTSLFRFLSLRVKGDDRRYYINVQTDSLDPIELWQHRLFLRTPGKWETVLIPWGDFLRTRNGRISYKKFDGMDRERVKTVGASLIERKEGPFCLYVAEIKVAPPLPPPPSLSCRWHGSRLGVCNLEIDCSR